MNSDKQNTNTQMPGFNGHILVVEDAPANQMLIKILLKKLGLEVSIAANGKEGYEMATSQNFDLVFMDMQMPIMNGYDATSKLREDGYSTPIIAMTASSMEGDLEKCMEAGCDGYMSKPIDRKILSQTISKYLAPDNEPLDSKIASLKQQIDKLNDLCSPNERQPSKTPKTTTETVKINYASAIKCCGDDSVIQRTANSILRDGPTNIKHVEDAVKNNNTKDTILYAHKLKGVCLIIGAEEMAAAAGLLESSAQNNDLQKAPAMIEDINTEFNKLASFLSQPDWIEKVKTTQQDGSNSTCDSNQ